MTPQERINHFMSDPATLDMLKEKKGEYISDKKSLIQSQDDNYKRKSVSTSPESWCWDFMIRGFVKLIDTCDREIRRFERMINIMEGKDVGKGFDLEEIKQLPIGDLMPTPPKRGSGDRVSYLCPIHNESTASFIWYKKQNRFFCFGCTANGTVIDLYMALNNVDFRTACKQLNK